MDHLFWPLLILAVALAFWAAIQCERRLWRRRVKDMLVFIETRKAVKRRKP